MNGMDLTLGQVAAWLGANLAQCDAVVRVQRVHTDSRSIRPGDLFVAIPGERFDGSQFVAAAARQGAVAFVCEASARDHLPELECPGLFVADARKALGDLAAGWRRQFELPLIAVTGSNGKTTVTQMIASVLRSWKSEASLATVGNLNNDIGVPLTLLNLRPWHQVAVVELGMNHPGEIARLAEIAGPTVAVVNNAQREHQEFMRTVEAVASENGAVIAALPPDGTAVFPADDAFSLLWARLAGDRNVCTFAPLTGGDPVGAAFSGSGLWTGEAWEVEARTPSGPLHYTLRVAGAHNVRNSLAAASAAMAAGAPLPVIANGLSTFEPVKGRSRAIGLRMGERSLTVVDDTYNANPDSVRAAIDVLVDLPGPRLLVLGDMGEVGDQGPAFHEEIGAYARQRGVEHLFGLGDLTIHAVAAFHGGCHFPDVEALQSAIGEVLPKVGSVVVKGSRFMRMERVVETITSIVQRIAQEHSHAA